MLNKHGWLPLLAIFAFLFSSAVRAAEKQALLVSVTHFKDGKVAPPLGGTVDTQQDIPTMSHALAPFGFKTTVLKNDTASRQQILDALNVIADKAQPDDTIVFYFSGHGANAKQHFSLCPWDAQKQSSDHDVTEDDLLTWLDKLKARNVTNVTLILDCCFTPSGSRSAVASVRTKFLKHDDDKTGDGQQVHIPADRAVILTAAGQNGVAHQVMFDTEGNGIDTWIGMFTEYLAQELLKAVSVPETYRELIANVKSDMQKLVNKRYPAEQQTPDIHGADAMINRPLFTPVDPSEPHPEPAPVKLYLTVTKVSDGQIFLNQGQSAGVKVGAEYALYRSDETEFTDLHKQIGAIKIASVTPDEAVGQPLSGVDAGQITPNCRARLTRYPENLTSDKVKVRLEGSPEYQASVAEALKSNPFLQVLTDPNSEPHIVLKGETAANRLTARLLAADDTTPLDSGNPTYRGRDGAELVKNLTQQLDQIVTLRAISLLDNPSKPFHLEITSDKRQYAVGQSPTFVVNTDRDCYLILIDIDAAGTPSLLFPGGPGDDNLARAGKPMTLPDITITPPVGKDTLVALAITDANQAERIKKLVFELQQAPTQEPTGSRGARHYKDLRKVWIGPTDIWTVAQLDFQTVKSEEAGTSPSGTK